MKRTLAALVAATALLAACGDTDADDQVVGGDPAAEEPAGGGEPGTDAPERIVSLSPSATELLFAIGAGDQVVAVDNMSNHPSEAPMTDLSAFEPNLEAISTHEPDLVVVDGTDPELVEGLTTVGIEVLAAPAPATLEDLYAQIEELGEATGEAEGAADLVAEMTSDIEAILAEVPELDEPLTFFHELDDLLYSVTSSTFIGELYAMVGLENVADAADPDGAHGGYPQLSAEYLVEADPDLVFLADTKCCAQTPETFAARPGFGSLTAVREGNVVALDDDVASRWGPRVVDLLEEIVEAVASASSDEAAAA
ncbi:MAG: ABC transporter substrate-binding protein [Acidimicrobiia bacterium]